MTSDKCAILQQWYEKTLSGPNAVYNVFIDYYGPERVDMQTRSLEDCILHFTNSDSDNITYYSFLGYLGTSYDIIVHFPEVRISNENNAYVDIKDLWAKIPLKILRTGYDSNNPDSYECKMYNSFTFTRSNFPINHLRSDYMHSHCPGIPLSDTWLSCCLGNGPIKRTVATLCSSPDIDIWSLFVYELDLYTRTESISGGPYRYMSNIINGNAVFTYFFDNNRFFYTDSINVDNKGKRLLGDFLRYFIKNKRIPFKYASSWEIAMPYFDVAMLLSKSFIEWFNREDNRWNTVYSTSSLISAKILKQAKTANNRIEYMANSRHRQKISEGEVERMNNKLLFTFKGQPVRVTIDMQNEVHDNYCYLLCPDIIRYILTTMLNYINLYYGTNQ